MQSGVLLHHDSSSQHSDSPHTPHSPSKRPVHSDGGKRLPAWPPVPEFAAEPPAPALPVPPEPAIPPVAPVDPAVPADPEEPDCPAVPETAPVPLEPAVPAAPAVPAVPADPDVPAEPVLVGALSSEQARAAKISHEPNTESTSFERMRTLSKGVTIPNATPFVAPNVACASQYSRGVMSSQNQGLPPIPSRHKKNAFWSAVGQQSPLPTSPPHSFIGVQQAGYPNDGSGKHVRLPHCMLPPVPAVPADPAMPAEPADPAEPPVPPAPH